MKDSSTAVVKRPGFFLWRWLAGVRESISLAFWSILSNKLRSFLAISGIVVGIVTVVLVASVLANVRNQLALLFRELGTENVFAYHLTGDPAAPASEKEAGRRPLEPGFAKELKRLGEAISDVGVEILVPGVVNGRALTARAGGNESDNVFVDGVSWTYFDIIGAEFAEGRPFTELEGRAGARVCVIGANLSQALFGNRSAVGRTLTLAGQTYTVVGELARKRGGFFGENRQDIALSLPLGAVQRRFPQADRTVLYIRAKPNRLEQARQEAEFILRRLRELGPAEPNDFNLSTAESIIRNFDAVSARIGLVTVALAAVSLAIGGIGIANVMIIGVLERTREIGIRLAVGARRREVRGQFLLEASFLSIVGGVAGVGIAFLCGLGLKLFLGGFSAVPPVWAIAAGVAASLLVGVVAGYWPASRAARMDPVEALRHE